MKNNILSVIFQLFIIIFLLSNTVTALAMADSSYFPLNIGNEWTFESQYSQRTDKIVDTSWINGKIYFNLWNSGGSQYLRSSDDSIFLNQFLQTGYPEDILLYHFGGDVGDTVLLPSRFRCSFGKGIILTGKKDTVITMGDTFFNCIHFKHDTWCYDVGIKDAWFAKGIGKIKQTEITMRGKEEYTLSSYNLFIDSSTLRVRSHTDPPNMLATFPNPFNTIANLSYNIEEADQVNLSIVDLTGRQIACLESGHKLPGEYKTCWDAAGMPDGVYIAVIRTRNLFKAKKLILKR